MTSVVVPDATWNMTTNNEHDIKEVFVRRKEFQLEMIKALGNSTVREEILTSKQ